ncbi:hypothetical protein RKE30_20560 [Streptomyces sp. Li-HN-5-11]|uniref:hypothetical protein n=1 Tax=Streptomyces sp. Li-HN-5-11 TaxID=3075432 RepID=UPI0028A890F0|nr:hypothetical protein [Streptomyces sp. Li-HN-5-11]WNM32631.1 hypothetical protein RKE30_20560 [Streptomyces sp. Li-HN-5-11]WOP38617.1 hypothetical protein RKE32_35020 [Streptomyces sp. Li-HN-5-13]
MTEAKILALLLACSLILNLSMIVGLIAHGTGVGARQAVLTAAGAAATCLALYFAAVSAYR